MIYVCEHHDAVLQIWRQQEARQISLTHVDFHDDLRGLVVDRRRRRAYAVAGGLEEVDVGNYLAHAVLERRIERVQWVHDIPGGRMYDWGIVRYESDIRAVPDRLWRAIRRSAEVPFSFEESLLSDWRGVPHGDRLSVCWDCFASILQDPSGTRGRVEVFLERLGSAIPPDTYLAYSPDYCVAEHLPLFLDLVETLSQRFGQPVTWLSPNLRIGEVHPEGNDARLPTGWLSRSVFWLHRKGIY
ncbi:MAG: UPF0489 family protein [Burkholderiales bacterium]|nr:UPF0489 family protein [Burkholderiales bacterium]